MESFVQKMRAPSALHLHCSPSISPIAGTHFRSSKLSLRAPMSRVVPCVFATSAQLASETSPAEKGANKLTSITSLKEWAPTCSALGFGDQTVILRKGGIKEPTFTPAAKEFLLFPTAFHTDAQLLKPDSAKKYAEAVRFDPRAQQELEFSVFARVTGAWTTFDPSVLQLLDGLHCWAPEFLETRLKWRGKQPITVLELRAYRLQEPLRVPTEDQFWGCFSWIDIPLPQQPGSLQQLLQHAQPPLSDDEFATRQEECRSQLGKIEVRQLQL